jgi:tetratricopeptide (TPR) repeat protein
MPASALYRALFTAGTALLLAGVVAGIGYSFRTASRLPPLALNSLAGNDLSGIEPLVGLGTDDGTVAQLRLALRLLPGSQDRTYELLGRALQARGELEEAIEQFRRALRIDPRFAEAHNNLGVALAKQGRLVEAIAEVREALRLKPDLTEANVNLARMEANLARAGSATDPTELPPEIRAGRDYAQQFYLGRLEELHARFAPDFARQLPLAGLIELRRTAARQLGAELEVRAETVGSIGDSRLYVRRARFEHYAGDVDVVAQLASDGSLLGFMLRPSEPSAE